MARQFVVAGSLGGFGLNETGVLQDVALGAAFSAVPLPASCHNGLAAMLAERLALGKARADGRAVSPAPAVIEMAARGRNQIRALLTRRPIVTPADLPVLSRSVQAFW